MLTIVVCLIEGPVNAHFERAGIGISKVTEYLKFVTDFGPAPLGIGENVVVFNPSPSKEPSGASGNLLKVFRPNIGRLGGDSYFWADHGLLGLSIGQVFKIRILWALCGRKDFEVKAGHQVLGWSLAAVVPVKGDAYTQHFLGGSFLPFCNFIVDGEYKSTLAESQGALTGVSCSTGYGICADQIPNLNRRHEQKRECEDRKQTSEDRDAIFRRAAPNYARFVAAWGAFFGLLLGIVICWRAGAFR